MQAKRPVPTSRSLDEAVDAVLASSRALVAVSARSIAGAQGVTLPQYRMLVVLSGTATNLTVLAAALDVAPSTALRMVDRLESAGLLERSVNPENRRETRLTLTGAGRRAVRTVNARRRRDLAAVLARLSPEEQAALANAMTAFARAADTLWPGEAATIS
ncbi:MAG: MarR family transcriptional regulator [Jatrophihabitantaceae bacterium]